MTKVQYNVKENYTEEAAKIFEAVSNSVKKSFGPYGANTIIEKNGIHHFSKDGWTILKSILFKDHFGRSIHQLISEICSQVVVKVGDGSTSSLIAASKLYSELQKADTSKIRPKDLMDYLTDTVNLIVSEITKLSTRVDDDFESIYRIAKISTNGDEEIAKMIQDIYQKTNNSSIEFVKGGQPRTEYEIIDGYRANISYLDQMYATNDRGEAHIKDPIFIFIDNEMDTDTHSYILSLAKDRARSEGRRLVVISPRYDRIMLETIRHESNAEYRSNGTTNTVYCRASVVTGELQLHYHDFALMTGATIIDYAFVDAFNSKVVTIDEETQKRSISITEEAADMVYEALGYTKDVVIGPKFTTISGFFKRNDHMYSATLKTAQAEVARQIELHKELNTVNIDLYKAQTRLSKLNGVMGVISVGGTSPLSRDANYDLVEDAVKACESATRHGYNLGGNLIIGIAIENIRNSHVLTEQMTMLLDIIGHAFKQVYVTLLENAYEGTTIEIDYDEVYKTAIEKQSCFDLVTQEYNNNVINSSEADIEVLKASLSIVGLILTSNQYLSNSPEVFQQ